MSKVEEILQATMAQVDQRELRHTLRPVELRAATDEPTILSGYAALFDTPATIADQFIEVIDPGAFDQALTDDVRVLFNHDPSQLLGRTKNGTASLSVDQHGLKYEVTPPLTTTGQDVLKLVDRGDVDGSSFGFQVLQDRWVEGATADELPVRHLESVRLFDVSPVTQPAYAETTVEARAKAWTLSDQVQEEKHNPTGKGEPAGDIPISNATPNEVAWSRTKLARHLLRNREQ